jgi:hypothetical protein
VSAEWARPLQRAVDVAFAPHGKFAKRHGARSCGAVQEVRAGRWKIARTVDATERLAVWTTEADWDREAATWLTPRSKEISDMLEPLPVPEREHEEVRP